MNRQNIRYFRNFKFCFFTRNGGVSKKNFCSLNCAHNIEKKRICKKIEKSLEKTFVKLKKSFY